MEELYKKLDEIEAQIKKRLSKLDEKTQEQLDRVEILRAELNELKYKGKLPKDQ